MSFFKDHVAGISALAITTGVVATFLYDYFELKPQGTFFARPSATQKQSASTQTTATQATAARPVGTSERLREKFKFAKEILWAKDRDPELERLAHEAIQAGDIALAKEIARDILWADPRDKVMRAILQAQR